MEAMDLCQYLNSTYLTYFHITIMLLLSTIKSYPSKTLMSSTVKSAKIKLHWQGIWAIGKHGLFADLLSPGPGLGDNLCLPPLSIPEACCALSSSGLCSCFFFSFNHPILFLNPVESAFKMNKQECQKLCWHFKTSASLKMSQMTSSLHQGNRLPQKTVAPKRQNSLDPH